MKQGPSFMSYPKFVAGVLLLAMVGGAQLGWGAPERPKRSVIILIPEHGVTITITQLLRPGRMAPLPPQTGRRRPPDTDPDTPAPTPPGGQRARPRPPVKGTEEGVRELLRYGIKVRGAYTPNDIKNTLDFAHCFSPKETRGMVVTFDTNRKKSGVVGVWSNGNVRIMSSKPDVIFHEGCHHITLYRKNTRTRALGKELFQKAMELGGDGGVPLSCVTRQYALRNSSEFRAEILTGLAGLESRVKLSFTLVNRKFNPPASVRALARKIFSPAPRRG
jgi:hypothetical protein